MEIKEVIEKNKSLIKKAKTIETFMQKEKNLNKKIYEVDNPYFFFTAISTLNAQAKAPLAQKFIGLKMNWQPVKAKEERGDFLEEKTEKYIELKNSFTNKEQKLNLRQIRLYQDIDFYLCVFIDEEKLEESIFYYLSKEEMEKEVRLLGGFTHGTKNVNESNKKPEYSITISVKNNSNEHTKRWNKLYKNENIKNVFFEVSDE